MSIYTIYALGESNISITPSGQLDGVNQGTGEHLDGLTITIDTPNWEAISVNDTDDDDFGDSDNSQLLNGTQVFDGVTYTGTPRVEAEYGLTVSDGTDTWTLVGFNINNGSPSYATVEGLAVIGGPGDFPPAGVGLTVTGFFEGPNFAASTYATPICFAQDTQIACAAGVRPVETLKVGDLVQTEAHGLQAVRWIGSRMLPAVGRMAPVEFAPGVLGNARALRVSQQHRVLIEGWRAELFFGQERVLVPAHRLVNGTNVRLVKDWRVLYVHFLLDMHALVCAEGAFCESLYPGEQTLSVLGTNAAQEIGRLVRPRRLAFAAPVVDGAEACLGAIFA